MIAWGKYCLRQEYKHLAISETKWFSVTRDQHIREVGLTPVSDVVELEEGECADESAAASTRSMPFEGMQNNCWRQKGLLHQLLAKVQIHVWFKVVQASSPTWSSPSVMALPMNVPSIVPVECVPKRKPLQKSTVISQSLLLHFKKAPNLTKLATATMPKGRGCKGGKAPPKRKKSETIEHRCELNPLPEHSSTGPVVDVPVTFSFTCAGTAVSAPGAVSFGYSGSPVSVFLPPPMTTQPVCVWLLPNQCRAHQCHPSWHIPHLKEFHIRILLRVDFTRFMFISLPEALVCAMRAKGGIPRTMDHRWTFVFNMNNGKTTLFPHATSRRVALVMYISTRAFPVYVPCGLTSIHLC